MSLSSHQIVLLCLIVFLSLIPIIAGILFLYWDRIVRAVTKKIYSIKFPHKIIEIIIRYPANKFDKIYRLIPDEQRIGIGSGEYFFTESKLAKHSQMLDKLIFKDKSDKLCFRYEPDFKGIIKDFKDMTPDEKKMFNAKKNPVYYITEEMLTKDKDGKMPTIEYWFNCPNPIEFDFTHKEIKLTSKMLKEYKENDLVQKLLRLSGEEMKMLIIIILVGICLIMGGYNAYISTQIHDGLVKAGIIAKSMIPLIAIPILNKKDKS
jgi:hypothetical protein